MIDKMFEKFDKNKFLLLNTAIKKIIYNYRYQNYVKLFTSKNKIIRSKFVLSTISSEQLKSNSITYIYMF